MIYISLGDSLSIDKNWTFSDSKITQDKHNKTRKKYFFSKDVFRYLLFPRIKRDWNSLPDVISNLENADRFVKHVADYH